MYLKSQLFLNRIGGSISKHSVLYALSGLSKTPTIKCI